MPIISLTDWGRSTALTVRLWFFFVFALAGLSAQAGDAFKVVVSIKPVHSVVAGLMEGLEPPLLLIEKDQTPYDFRLTDRQRSALKQADLLVWVGPELESSLRQPIEDLIGQVRVVELLDSPSLKILPSRLHDDRRDPFFWLDNRNMLLLLDDLTELLQQSDPRRAHVYGRNRLQILQRLSRLDREFEYGYRDLKTGAAVAYYDTLYYFEQAYALKILDRVMESPRDRLDVAALLRARQHLQNGDAACLLTERGLPMPQLDLLTEGLRVNRVELDSLGGQFPAGVDLYFQMMEHNNAALHTCLKPDIPAKVTPDSFNTSIPEDGESGIGGGRYLLTDQYGRLVTPDDLLGHYQLLYFGYTHCPDVCPNTLQIVSLALDRLGPKAGSIRPYFITVDPERDSVKVIIGALKSG